jgi:hypothetical protein
MRYKPYVLRFLPRVYVCVSCAVLIMGILYGMHVRERVRSGMKRRNDYRVLQNPGDLSSIDTKYCGTVLCHMLSPFKNHHDSVEVNRIAMHRSDPSSGSRAVRRQLDHPRQRSVRQNSILDISDHLVTVLPMCVTCVHLQHQSTASCS